MIWSHPFIALSSSPFTAALVFDHVWSGQWPLHLCIVHCATGTYVPKYFRTYVALKDVRCYRVELTTT